MDVITENKRLIPLNKVVSAAAMDMYADYGQIKESYQHWAARGLRKLQGESLRYGRRRILLYINRHTNTATLPCDFQEEFFVGIINDAGEKIPLRLNSDSVLIQGVETQDEDKCDKCGIDKNVCNELTVTETIDYVNLNGIAYQQTTVKKMQPNGDYYLESSIPYLNIETNEVEYNTSKEFITHFDVNEECGCVIESSANIAKIKSVCPDLYYCRYSECGVCGSVDYGGYHIFEESGLIQFDKAFKFDRAYLEYWGFIPKINGQYRVPAVAFETLVNWVKFKSIENRKGVPNNDKIWFLDRYKEERKNMAKRLGRLSLNTIISRIGLVPKFDITLAPSFTYPCVSTASESTSDDALPPTAPTTPPPSVVKFTAYWGYKDTITAFDTVEEMKSASTGDREFNHGAKVEANYRDNSLPKFLWMTEPVNEPAKTKWDGDGAGILNQGDIGGVTGVTGNLFADPIIIDDYRFYITEYETANTANEIEFKTS